MMRMRVGLHQALDDPVSLVIFSLICMYFTQYWWPPRVRISCCSIIIYVMINLFKIANT